MLNEHSMQIRVRYCETDAMACLHHSQFFNYFEQGRTELLRAQGGNYREIEEAGLFLVVVRLQCSYHAPARYDDVLTLVTRTQVPSGDFLPSEGERPAVRSELPW